MQPLTGLLRSVCHIPGTLPNSGFHRVALFLVRGNMASTYRLDEAVGFEVVHNPREIRLLQQGTGVGSASIAVGLGALRANGLGNLWCRLTLSDLFLQWNEMKRQNS